MAARGRSRLASSASDNSAGSDTLYGQMLLFPERAEFLPQSQYRAYRLQLDHWRELSLVFRRAFQTVYDRQSASVLLVHGEQGTGKTAFTGKLAADFAKSRSGVDSADPENLWHVLTGGAQLDFRIIKEATKTTELTVLAPRTNWLSDVRVAARASQQKMRVFVIDDFHKDLFLGEWAGPGPSIYSTRRPPDLPSSRAWRSRSSRTAAVISRARCSSSSRQISRSSASSRISSTAHIEGSRRP